MKKYFITHIATGSAYERNWYVPSFAHHMQKKQILEDACKFLPNIPYRIELGFL